MRKRMQRFERNVIFLRQAVPASNTGREQEELEHFHERHEKRVLHIIVCRYRERQLGGRRIEHIWCLSPKRVRTSNEKLARLRARRGDQIELKPQQLVGVVAMPACGAFDCLPMISGNLRDKHALMA
jgi:hypothetical protein